MTEPEYADARVAGGLVRRGIARLAEVARAIDAPVMADESAWNAHDVIEIAERRAAQIVSIYTTKPGGLYRAMEVAAVARAAGLICNVNGSVETGIGNLANLALAAAAPVAVLSRFETSMPSIVNLFSLLVPCSVADDCRKPSEPPTSTLLNVTPGSILAIAHTSLRFGIASSASREMTVCRRAVVVSSNGASPLTVTPSERDPISSFRSARAVTSEFTTMFRCSAGRKPCNSAFTMYVPGDSRKN